jgi:GTP-binding protein
MRAGGERRSERSEARFVAGAARPERIPRASAAEVAFAGRSNVGKSSLLNRLIGRHGLARVSKTPGRTQQINFFALGEEVCFVDLPGYGFAKVPRPIQESWRQLVEAYLTARPALRGVIVIIDARRGLGDEDRRLIEFLDAHGIASVLVANKIDKLSGSARKQLETALRREHRGEEPILFSARSGEGATELWQRVRALTAVERGAARREKGIKKPTVEPVR